MKKVFSYILFLLIFSYFHSNNLFSTTPPRGPFVTNPGFENKTIAWWFTIGPEQLTANRVEWYKSGEPGIKTCARIQYSGEHWCFLYSPVIENIRPDSTVSISFDHRRVSGDSCIAVGWAALDKKRKSWDRKAYNKWRKSLPNNEKFWLEKKALMGNYTRWVGELPSDNNWHNIVIKLNTPAFDP